MSSTHKTKSERGLDFFATPAWVVRSLIPCLRWSLTAPNTVLDPCAGHGAILKTLLESPPRHGGLRHAGLQISAKGLEIQPELVAEARKNKLLVAHRDAMGSTDWGRPDKIIQNPPFLSAQAFVERALEEVRPGGEVAVLLRLAFLSSQERAEFHKKHPSDVLVLPRRPSFCVVVRCAEKCGWEITLSPEASLEPYYRGCPACIEKKETVSVKVTRTDSSDYAWFVWGEGRGGRWKVLEVSE